MPNPPRPGVKPAAPKPAAKRDAPNYSTSTTTGVEPNVAAALSYILGLITGVVFLVLEKENRYVRFHAAQSIVVSAFFILVNVGVALLSGVVAFVPLLGWLVVFLLTAGLAVTTFVLWLVLMYRAYQGEEWELPVAGEMARKLV
jgi:uncharacterized membrane protein